jgi:PhoD related phosphatase
MAANRSEPRSSGIGPMLYLRGYDSDRLLLSALVVRPAGERPGVLKAGRDCVSPTALVERCGMVVDRYLFKVPVRADAGYEFGGSRFCVNADVTGDLRIAYVSCNGMEHGDLDRPEQERNALWRRLAEQHAATPFNLLLHGGDQVYSDEMPDAHPASRGWPRTVPDQLNACSIAELDRVLRDAFFRRYLHVFGQPEFAWLAARVPSLAMWDDHDIADGWGSYPDPVLDSEVGRCIFSAARESFLFFQLAAAPGELPDFCPDGTGENLTWSVGLPGFQLVAPDLRSERRRFRVMGERGWNAFRTALSGSRGSRVLLLSSVPAIGPRLSILERFMYQTPWKEEYQDDLNDQWQSIRHRAEWRKFLREVIELHEHDGTRVTFLSGEIHLATRGTVETATGELHQLVASGIAHPPPGRMRSRVLGAFANLAESPLAGYRMRLRPLPGQRAIYTPERNYLVLNRSSGQWSAVWELEHSGATPPLII